MNSNDKLMLKNILETYDMNKTMMDKKLKDMRYYKIIYNKINEMDEMVIYEKNKKEIFKSKIQILGIYIPNHKLWKWGWSLFVTRKLNYLSKEVLKYALEINNINLFFIREPLINSNIKIENELELDLLVAVGSYLTKQPMIKKFYKMPYEDNEDEDYEEVYDINVPEDNPNKNDYICYYYILIDENQ